eukprot:m.994762 g.994762  ORF g.994762 m.994762 type:complete len:1439 (-) comp24013_c0_seq2:707-5023(-)
MKRAMKAPTSESSSVVVAVRCRPFSTREVSKNEARIIDMSGGKATQLTNPRDQHVRAFAFDHSFNSYDDVDSHFVDQETVYQALGRGALDNALNGFNACIFAYGQTGSGKTHSMMGDPTSPKDCGIVPRLCSDLFVHVTERASDLLSFSVEVSYMEIYNEQVFDLLQSVKKSQSLKLRNHRTLGPYVEGLSKFAVSSFSDILNFMENGNALRRTAATKMNDTSSRSHAIFTLTVKQIIKESVGHKKSIGEKVSKVSLVDLAGSERQSKTGATGNRLKEGAGINKSLTTLGMVIAALADNATKGLKGDAHIPYRDSTLTFLLRESLGGNSKTVMLATISPASCNYEETLSTLRYADRAKQIVNKAFINEDATAAIVQGLRNELEALRMQVASQNQGLSPEEISALQSEVEENERLLKEANLTWEEKLRNTERELRARAEKAETEVAVHVAEKEVLLQQMQALQSEKDRMAASAAAREAAVQAQIAAAAQAAEAETARLAALKDDELQREKTRAQSLEASLAQMTATEHALQRKHAEMEAMRARQAQLEADLAAKEAQFRAARESDASKSAVVLAAEAEKHRLAGEKAALEQQGMEEGMQRQALQWQVQLERIQREELDRTMDIISSIDTVDDDITAFMAKVVAAEHSAAAGGTGAAMEESLAVLRDIEAQTKSLRVTTETRIGEINATHATLLKTITENLATSLAVAQGRKSVDLVSGVVDQAASATLAAHVESANGVAAEDRERCDALCKKQTEMLQSKLKRLSATVNNVKLLLVRTAKIQEEEAVDPGDSAADLERIAQENKTLKSNMAKLMQQQETEKVALSDEIKARFDVAEIHEKELARHRIEVEMLRAARDALQKEKEQTEQQAADERRLRILREAEIQSKAREQGRLQGQQHTLAAQARDAQAKEIEETVAQKRLAEQQGAEAAARAEALAAQAAELAAEKAKMEEAAAVERAKRIALEAEVAVQRQENASAQQKHDTEAKNSEASMLQLREQMDKLQSAAAVTPSPPSRPPPPNTPPATPTPVAPTRKRSFKLMKRVRSVTTMTTPPETVPELTGDKSAALQMYEAQLDKLARTCSGPRRGYVHERGALLKNLMSLKQLHSDTSARLAKLAQPAMTDADGDSGDTGVAKPMKVALELKKIELDSKQQAEDCQKSASKLVASATAIEKLHKTLETKIQALLEAAAADEALSDASEIAYLTARCQHERYSSNVACREALEAAAHGESLRESYASTHEDLARIFAAVLGITSEAEKEKLVRAAEAEKAAKFTKKRNAIATMAKAPFGDQAVERKVNLEKYVVEALDTSRAALKDHVKIGQYVMQGWLFKPRKEQFERWFHRHLLLDLRARNISYAGQEHGKVKKQIQLKDIIACKATDTHKISQRLGLREDNTAVENVFVIVTAKRTWYFSAATATQKKIWVAAIQAVSADVTE